jgi:hypothetical protein
MTDKFTEEAPVSLLSRGQEEHCGLSPRSVPRSLALIARCSGQVVTMWE